LQDNQEAGIGGGKSSSPDFQAFSQCLNSSGSEWKFNIYLIPLQHHPTVPPISTILNENSTENVNTIPSSTVGERREQTTLPLLGRFCTFGQEAIHSCLQTQLIPKPSPWWWALTAWDLCILPIERR
jgi:hypothetical protein